jgi:hypothetical protein
VKRSNVIDAGSHRGQRRPEVIAAREKAKRTDLNITCEGCGATVYSVRQHTYNSAPKTHFKMASQGMAKHMRESGCSGNRPGPVIAPATLEAVAGDELDIIAMELGIPRDQAAALAGETLTEMRKGPSLAMQAIRNQKAFSNKPVAGDVTKRVADDIAAIQDFMEKKP